ncbi:MAG: TolC family protein [Flavobacteriales bacterium]
MIRVRIPYRAFLGTFLLGFLFAFPGLAQEKEKTSKGGGKVWSLKECVNYAHENNLQVRQRKLSVKSSELDRKQSYYDLLPNLTAFGSHGYNWGQRVDQFTNKFVTRRVRSNRFSLSSELVLFRGMERFQTIKQREQDLKAAKAKVDEAKNEIALKIATTYMELLFNKEILKVRKEQRDRTKLQVDRMRSLYDAGEVSKGEMLDMISQWESEKLNVTKAKNDLQLKRLDLIQVLQLKGSKARNFQIQEPPTGKLDVDTLRKSPQVIFDKALEEMPSIRAAEASIKSAQKGLAIARSGRSPTLSLSGSYGTGYSGQRKELVGQPELAGFDTIGRTAPSGEAVLTPRFDKETRTVPFWEQLDANLNQNLSLQLSIPIFQRMSTNTRIKKARINLQKAKLEKASAKDQLRQDIQRAYADAIAAMRKYRASKKTVEAREESFSSAEARYEAGSINTVDYVEAKTKLTQARSEMLQAKYEQLFKRKVLRFYLGDPLTLKDNP